MKTYLDGKISSAKKKLKRLQKERDLVRQYNRAVGDALRQAERTKADLEREAKRCRI